MDLRQLRYFAAIVELGSLSKAAAALGVAQPALSQHIRHMEQDLGVQILHRTSRGVQPTDAGTRLLAHAKLILAQFDELRNAVQEGNRNPVGEVRFGMPGTVCEILGVPLIEAARRLYPGIRIRIVEAMSGFILDWLLQGEVDLALIFSTARLEGLKKHACLSEELRLFCARERPGPAEPPGSPVPLREALARDLVLPGRNHGLRALVEDAAAKIPLPVDPLIELDSYRQIKEVARKGLAFGILPQMAVDADADAGLFTQWPIVDPPLQRQVYLAYSRERPLLTPSRAIGQLSWQILRDLVTSGTWTATWIGDGDNPALYP